MFGEPQDHPNATGRAGAGGRRGANAAQVCVWGKGTGVPEATTKVREARLQDPDVEKGRKTVIPEA